MTEKEDPHEDGLPLTAEELNELAKPSPKAEYLKHWKWAFFAFAVLAFAMDYLFDGLFMQLLRGTTATKD